MPGISHLYGSTFRGKLNTFTWMTRHNGLGSYYNERVNTMKLYHRKAILSFGFLAVTGISLIVLLASSVLTLAAPPGAVRPHDGARLTKGPVAWPVKKSQPLHQPINAPKLVTFAP